MFWKLVFFRPEFCTFGQKLSHNKKNVIPQRHCVFQCHVSSAPLPHRTVLVCRRWSSDWRTRRQGAVCCVAGQRRMSDAAVRWPALWPPCLGRRRESTASGRPRNARKSTSSWTDAAAASVAVACRTTEPRSLESAVPYTKPQLYVS